MNTNPASILAFAMVAGFIVLLLWQQRQDRRRDAREVGLRHSEQFIAADRPAQAPAPAQREASPVAPANSRRTGNSGWAAPSYGSPSAGMGHLPVAAYAALAVYGSGGSGGGGDGSCGSDGGSGDSGGAGE